MLPPLQHAWERESETHSTVTSSAVPTVMKQKPIGSDPSVMSEGPRAMLPQLVDSLPVLLPHYVPLFLLCAHLILSTLSFDTCALPVLLS